MGTSSGPSEGGRSCAANQPDLNLAGSRTQKEKKKTLKQLVF